MSRIIVVFLCLCALSTLATGYRYRQRRHRKAFSGLRRKSKTVPRKPTSTASPKETRFCVRRPSRNADEPFTVYVTFGSKYVKHGSVYAGKQKFFSSRQTLNAENDAEYHGMTGVEVAIDCSKCPDPEECPGVCEALFLCRCSEEELNNAKSEEEKRLNEHGYTRKVIVGEGKNALKVIFKFDKNDIFGDVKVSMNPGRGQWRYFNEPLVGWGNGPCKYNVKGIDNEKAVCFSMEKIVELNEPDFVQNTCKADYRCVLQEESENSKWGKEGSKCRNNNGVCTRGGSCPKGSRAVRAWSGYIDTVKDHCHVDGKDGLCKDKEEGCKGGQFHRYRCTGPANIQCCMTKEQKKSTNECDNGLVCCREENIRGKVVGASTRLVGNLGTCVKDEESCTAIPGVDNGKGRGKGGFCKLGGKKLNGVACGIKRDRLLEWRKQNNVNFFGYTTEYRKKGTPGGNCIRDEDTLWEHKGGLTQNRDGSLVEPHEWDMSEGMCFEKKCPDGYDAFKMPNENNFLDHHRAEINDPNGERARKTSTVFCKNDVGRETVCCKPSKRKGENGGRRRLLGQGRGGDS